MEKEELSSSLNTNSHIINHGDLNPSDNIPPASPPPSNTSNHSRSKLGPIILVIVLTLITAGALFLWINNNNKSIAIPPPDEPSHQASPTPDPTLDWKTYKNEKLGFSIKYPDSVVIASDSKNDTNGDVTFALKEEENLNLYTRSMSLDILNRGKAGTSAYDAMLVDTPSSKACSGPNNYCIPENNPVVLNNTKGFEVKRTESTIDDYYLTNSDQTSAAVRIFADNNSVEKNNYNKNINQANVKIFKDMISTFKFTDSTSQSINSDWKSYTMPTEKLSFKYPSDWKITSETYPPDKNNYPFPRDYVLLKSPNNFAVTITTGNSYGGACPAECQAVNIKNVSLAKLNFYTSPLFIIVNGINQTQPAGAKANIIFNVTPLSSCYNNNCSGFAGKNSKLGITIEGGFLDVNGEYSFMDSNKFINSEDVKTAVKILETLKY